MAQSLRVPRDYVKALLNHQDGDVTAIYARWHMFDEKREAVLAVQKAVLPLMPAPAALAAEQGASPPVSRPGSSMAA
jgi:hypothetical protein